MNKCNITISRHSDDFMHITIEDDLSHATIVDIQMELDDFAKCITGQGALTGLIRRYPPKEDILGMQREVMRFALSGQPDSYDKKEMKKWVSAQFIEQCVDQINDGWGLWQDGCTTQQNVRDVHGIILDRYVENKGEEVR